MGVIVLCMILVYLVWSGERMMRVWLVSLVKGVDEISKEVGELRSELGEFLRRMK